MEINKFQILLITVTFFIFNRFKSWCLMCYKNVKKRIWTAPAVKGLNVFQGFKGQCMILFLHSGLSGAVTLAMSVLHVQKTFIFQPQNNQI